MKRVTFCSVVCYLVLGFCSSCFAETKPAASPPASKGEESVVAQIAENKITLKDLNKLILTLPGIYRSRFADFEGKKRLLEGLVEMNLLSAEALKLNLDKSPNFAEKEASMHKQLLSTEYKEYLKNHLTVTDGEIKTYYDQNRNRLQKQEEIKASHILVKTEEEAKDILAKLKKGKDFAELAKEKSTCPSKEKGGDLGWFPKGRMVPEFDKAAFSLKKGQLSDIVQTQFGFHIIRLDDRKEAEQKSLEEVKGQIIEMLKAQNVNITLKNELEKLKKDNNVQIFEEALR